MEMNNDISKSEDEIKIFGELNTTPVTRNNMRISQACLAAVKNS